MNILKALSTSPKPEPAKPVQCQTCRTAITHEQITRDMCPFLDSTGSRRGFLHCQSCGAHADFMVWRRDDSVYIEQVEIIGVPGPEYHEIATTHIQPSPEAFGWYLKDDTGDLWRERQWDHYLYNWLRKGVPVVCAYAGRPTAHEPERLAWIASYLETFTHTSYDEPVAVPRIDFGQQYDPEAPGYDSRLRIALNDLHETGYRAYHGGVLNLAWLNGEYPRLVEKLATVASLMPAQPPRTFIPPIKGVTIGGLQFTTGLHFAEGEERRHFESGGWDLIRSGTRELIEKFFTRDPEPAGTMRILVHTGDCWSTWRSFGPFATDEVWAEVIRLQEIFPPQRRLAPRVYEGRGSRMNKIEIYDGRRLVREIDMLT